MKAITRLVLLMVIFLTLLSQTAFGETGKWTNMADMASRLLAQSSAVVNGKIYLIGGGEHSDASATGFPALAAVKEYDPSSGTWTTKADMPTRRSNFAVVAVNGKIYAIGGAQDPFSPLATVEEYDPVKDTWTRRNDMPTPRMDFAASVVNGKIYAIGGARNHGSANSYATVEEYDPVKDKWVRKADMPTPRHYFGSSVVNGKIYAIGGTPDCVHAYSYNEAYDPVTDSWAVKADLPEAIEGLSTVTVGGKIYALGGSTGAATVSEVLKSMFEYDPSTDTWVSKINMTTARAWFSVSVVNGRIYAFGGLPTTGLRGLKTVEQYDTGLRE